ncbi:hypothetical protein Droror1_Dr00003642 [Drosera rotundifolia]
MVQTELMSSRIALTNALQSTNLQQKHNLMEVLPPPAVPQLSYSNNSTASNNLVNMVTNGYNDIRTATTAYDFDPCLHLWQPRGTDGDEDEQERKWYPTFI